MKRRLRLNEAVVSDLRVAIDWYEQQRPGLGEEFWADFDDACFHILCFPEGYSVKFLEFRQCPLNRFPYVVVYEIIGNEIVVFSVFHTSRDPEVLRD